jgi:hypothetical protein
MSEAAAAKPGKPLFAPEHAESLTRLKWLLPVVITVVVVVVLLIHYWTFLNTVGIQYIPVGFAVVLAVFLSALPAVMCFAQNVSRRRQLSKLNDLSALPLGTTTHYRTAKTAIGSVRFVVDADYALPIFLLFLTLFIGFTALLTAYSQPALFETPSVLLGRLQDQSGSKFKDYQLQTFAVIAMAFFGAYIYAIRRILDRINNGDLYPISLYYYTSRVIVACVAAAVLRHTAHIFGDASNAVSGNLSDSAAPLLLLLGFGIGFAPDLFILTMTRKAFQAMKIWGSRVEPEGTRPTSLPLLMIDDLTREKIDRLNELEIDSAQVLAQQNPFRLLPRVPYDLSLLIDWIAQAQLYVLVKDEILQKLRAIYIRNVFDFHIRLKDAQARREVCEALGLSDIAAEGILQQLECDASYLRLCEVKEAMKPPAAANRQGLRPGAAPDAK